jgi:hypothetical protein
VQQRISALKRDHAVRKRQLQDELEDARRQAEYNLTRLQGKCEEVKQLKLWIREWDVRYLDTSGSGAVVKEEAVKRQRVKEEEAEPQVKREVKLEASSHSEHRSTAPLIRPPPHRQLAPPLPPPLPLHPHPQQLRAEEYADDAADYDNGDLDEDGSESGAEEGDEDEDDGRPHARRG